MEILPFVSESKHIRLLFTTSMPPTCWEPHHLEPVNAPPPVVLGVALLTLLKWCQAYTWPLGARDTLFWSPHPVSRTGPRVACGQDVCCLKQEASNTIWAAGFSCAWLCPSSVYILVSTAFPLGWNSFGPRFLWLANARVLADVNFLSFSFLFYKISHLLACCEDRMDYCCSVAL